MMGMDWLIESDASSAWRMSMDVPSKIYWIYLRGHEQGKDFVCGVGAAFGSV